MHGEKQGESNMRTILTKTPAPGLDWSALVARIQAGEEAGSEKLYSVFLRGLRFYLARQLGGQDYEDKVHEVFVMVLRAIRKGDIREPQRLMGFVRTIARRQVASYIESGMQCRQKETDLESSLQMLESSRDPEALYLHRERIEILRSALQGLPHRDQEILIRFYLHEQPKEQICREMQLTATQFRLHKSRAKAKLGQLGKLRLRKASTKAIGNVNPRPLIKRASG
jgi:RNA polymerase sigma-70 factor, ECF subfamily